MKRFLALVLTAALVVMAACGTQSATPGTSTQTTPDVSTTAPASSTPVAAGTIDPNLKANITVFNWGNDTDVKINKAAYARFMAKYPNITVQDNFVTGTATWSEYITKLLSLVAAGNSPDMVMMAIEGAAQLVSNDVVVPLDDRISNDAEMQTIMKEKM